RGRALALGLRRLRLDLHRLALRRLDLERGSLGRVRGCRGVGNLGCDCRLHVVRARRLAIAIVGPARHAQAPRALALDLAAVRHAYPTTTAATSSLGGRALRPSVCATNSSTVSSVVRGEKPTSSI